MAKKKFKVGDAVILSIYGPQMVVAAEEDAAAKGWVSCLWFDMEQNCRDRLFPIAALMLDPNVTPQV